MNQKRKVIWSIESSRQVESIKTFLLKNWGETEASSFLTRLKKLEEFIALFPRLYPRSSTYPNLRKAPISKHQSVVYKVDNETIRIYTILDHRRPHQQ